MWNTNINEAPKGEMVTTKIITQKGLVDKQVWKREKVWLWSKCKKLILSSWIPEGDDTFCGNRWSGLAEGEQPLAWHEYKIPEPFEDAT